MARKNAKPKIDPSQDKDRPATCAEFAERYGRKPGDLVVLKSGGPSMTVLYSCCSEVECAWFDGHKLEVRDFPLEAIEASSEMPF